MFMYYFALRPDYSYENPPFFSPRNNATRHLCNLLKETCARSAEKTNKCRYLSYFMGCINLLLI